MTFIFLTKRFNIYCMLRYLKSINEELNITKLSDVEFDDLVLKVIKNLDQYKISILNNIDYNLKTNKIEYKDFQNINIEQILSQLNTDLGKDIVNQFNIEAFLRKIYLILDLKKRNTKKKVKEEFKNYYDSLEERFEDESQDSKEEDHFDKIEGEYSLLPRKKYEDEKYDIQVELMKLQEWVVKEGQRVAIVFEGRDSAGKGSTIKRFTEYLNPKYFKVVALGVPTEEEKNNWFGRYEKHLPKPGEIVFFDRSWYNRAVVEPAMGYCSEEQYMNFIENVSDWEEDLIKKGLILIKFWFSITKEKQQLRFQLRQTSPLKYWKFSPNDAKVVDKWDIITKYKNQMFNQTSTKLSPWVIINSNDKKIGRLNAMRYVLAAIDYENKDSAKSQYYPEVVNILK
jgi:polyphosphate kinase 2